MMMSTEPMTSPFLPSACRAKSKSMNLLNALFRDGHRAIYCPYNAKLGWIAKKAADEVVDVVTFRIAGDRQSWGPHPPQLLLTLSVLENRHHVRVRGLDYEQSNVPKITGLSMGFRRSLRRMSCTSREIWCLVMFNVQTQCFSWEVPQSDAWGVSKLSYRSRPCASRVFSEVAALRGVQGRSP